MLPSAAGAALAPFVTSWPINGNPYGIAADNAGFVYVVDNTHSRVQKFADNGVFVTQWGSFGNGNGQFYSPNDLAVNAAGTRVYVTDLILCRVQVFDQNGTYLSQWGSCYVNNLDTQDCGIWGIAMGPGGNVYAADAGCNMVKEFTGAGGLIFRSTTILAGVDCPPGYFSTPYAVASDAPGNLYVSSTGNGCIQKFGPGGSTRAQSTTWGRLRTHYRQ